MILLNIAHVLVMLILVMPKSVICDADNSVSDTDIEQKKVVWTVEYHGKSLSVWQQALLGNKSRYYVSPLCMIDFYTAKCIPDDYSSPPRFIFSFKLLLWDAKVESVVFKSLQDNGFNPIPGSIMSFPMAEIRFGLAAFQKKVKVDRQWRSYLGHEYEQTFSLYLKEETECQKLLNMTTTQPSNFIEIFKPYFEFKMIVKTAETRNINITGTTIQKSSVFNEMQNKYANQTNGIVYLQSKDINKLAEDLLTNVVYDEEVTENYLESGEEEKIILSIVKKFQDQQTRVADMTEADWNSVFWKEDYARPDIVTSYATSVFNHSDVDNSFSFDAAKDKEFRENFARTGSQEVGGSYGADFLGLLSAKVGAKVTNTQSDSGGRLTHNKSSYSEEEIKKWLSTQKNSAKWTGKQFVPKDLDLYRMNTKEMTSSNQAIFHRKITSKVMSKMRIQVSLAPPSICPREWSYNNSTSYCFKAFPERLSWYDAQKICVENGGNLASLQSKNDDSFIAGLLKPYGIHIPCWIGLYRSNEMCLSQINEIWIDQAPNNYVPHSFGNQDLSKCSSMCGVLNLPDFARSAYYYDDCLQPAMFMCHKKSTIFP